MKNIKEKFYVKQRDWNKFALEIQERLCATREVILTDLIPTKKQRLLKILYTIDITTKQGQQNMFKVFDKMEDVFKKMDKGMKQFDQAMDKAEKDLSKIGKTNKDSYNNLQ